MFFASKHVWDYDQSDEEVINDDDMKQAIYYSDSDDDDKPPETRIKSDADSPTMIAIDTNTISISNADENKALPIPRRYSHRIPATTPTAPLQATPTLPTPILPTRPHAPIVSTPRASNMLRSTRSWSSRSGSARSSSTGSRNDFDKVSLAPNPPKINKFVNLPRGMREAEKELPMLSPPPPPPPPKSNKKKGKHIHWLIDDFESRCEQTKSATTPITTPNTTTNTTTINNNNNNNSNNNDLRPKLKPKKIRKADTNVLSVNFRTLKESSNVFTGDAIFCSNCQSVLNFLSTINNNNNNNNNNNTTTITNNNNNDDGDMKNWKCEFCNHMNSVDIFPEEMPAERDVTYMLSAPSSSTTGSTASCNQSVIVFCIDISGSMAVTTEIAGNYKLREDDSINELLRELNLSHAEYTQQLLYNNAKAVTYISRLKSLQSAIQSQLDLLYNTNPAQKVALITFNNEVSILGDGTTDPVILTGDKLYDEAKLLEAGYGYPIPSAIKNSKQKLINTIWNLKDSGQTALGPSLVTAIAVASRGQAGSRVIICTDGLANIGVGQLEDVSTPEYLQEAEDYYKHISQLANDNSVVVSVMSLEGTECRLLELGQVADKTGGEVDRVDCSNILSGFSSMLAKPVLATNVSIRLLLHSRLYVREHGTSLDNRLDKPVGNVTEETELTFEYGIKKNKLTNNNNNDNNNNKLPGDQASHKLFQNLLNNNNNNNNNNNIEGACATITDDVIVPLMIEGKEHVPFQLQVTYTGRDGCKCLRVLTYSMPLTKDRELAERSSDFDILQTHVIKKSAEMALHGELGNSRANCISNQKMVYRIGERYNRKMEYRTWTENVSQTDTPIYDAVETETRMYGRNLSDDEEEFIIARRIINPVIPPKKAENTNRSKTVQHIRSTTVLSDTLSNRLYKSKAVSSPMKLEYKPTTTTTPFASNPLTTTTSNIYTSKPTANIHPRLPPVDTTPMFTVVDTTPRHSTTIPTSLIPTTTTTTTTTPTPTTTTTTTPTITPTLTTTLIPTTPATPTTTTTISTPPTTTITPTTTTTIPTPPTTPATPTITTLPIPFPTSTPTTTTTPTITTLPIPFPTSTPTTTTTTPNDNHNNDNNNNNISSSSSSSDDNDDGIANLF